MNKRMSINLIAQIISVICSIGVSLLLTPFVVSNLGTEVYGFVGLANNFTSYITMFTVALNGMLSRYVTVEYTKKNYDEAAGYLSTALITQIFLAIGLLVPAMLFAGNLDVFIQISPGLVSEVKILWILMFLAFLANLSTESLGCSVFASNRVDVKAGISIASHLIRCVILIVTFVFFTPHVWYIGIAAIASNIVMIIGNCWCKRKFLHDLPIDKKYFNRKYIYNLLIVGVWNSLNRLQQVLYTGLDLLLTNIFISSSEMGLLSIAKTLPTQISSLINTVSATFDPSMTIAYGKENKNEFLYQTQLAMKICGFICSVPIIGFVCLGNNFYELWLPELNEMELRKVFILSVLTLTPQVFSVFIYPLYTVNTITCKLKVPVLVSIGIGVTNIAVVFVLLKTTTLGVYAVAGVSSVLWLIRIFTFVPLYAAYNVGVKWTTFYGPLLRGVINVIVVTVLFSTIATCFHAKNWMEFLLICCAAAIIGYSLSSFVILGKKDTMKILRKFRKKHST